MEQVWEQQRGQGVVEVGEALVGVAEKTVGDRRGALHHMCRRGCFEGGFRLQSQVTACERTEGGKTCEEHVGGDLHLRRGTNEDVTWAYVGREATRNRRAEAKRMLRERTDGRGSGMTFCAGRDKKLRESEGASFVRM